jgi:hypothetical protein
MTHPHPRALEAAARAIVSTDNGDPEQIIYRQVGPDDFQPLGKAWELLQPKARAAVTAYIAAMPPRVSPELIAGLNALATYLTEQGEYEAVDLIDTVVARVIDAAPPAAQEKK